MEAKRVAAVVVAFGLVLFGAWRVRRALKGEAPARYPIDVVCAACGKHDRRTVGTPAPWKCTHCGERAAQRGMKCRDCGTLFPWRPERAARARDGSRDFSRYVDVRPASCPECESQNVGAVTPFEHRVPKP
jgi:hypothetical protein